MSRTLYLDCIGGLAGDMLLGALLSAGADEQLLLDLPGQLSMHGVQTLVTKVNRQGVEATHVRFAGAPEYGHRSWAEMRAALDGARLDNVQRERALAVFRRLADAEARAHDTDPELVHFHELGGDDTLLDICGAVVLLDDLHVNQVICSPLPYTRGVVKGAHGAMPTPAPATMELLRGALIVGIEAEIETVTPTGAVLAVELADSFGEVPPLVVERTGYGAGTADPPGRPNVVRAVLGTEPDGATSEVVLLETNIDDLVPELLPDAVELCFAMGALDVWVVPAQMKKGRPGFVLSAVARPAQEAAVIRAMLAETTSLGVRVSRMRRFELDRREQVVSITGGDVRVKVGLLDGKVVNLAPEHDDCAELARKTERSVKSVWAEALTAAQGITR